MADTSGDILYAASAALIADATVQSLVSNPARVYTKVPQNPTFPYIEVSYKNGGDFSGMDFTGMEHVVVVHCYSRANTLDEVYSMKKAVYNVLNRNESALSLSSGQLCLMAYNGVGHLGLDQDSVSYLGIAEFKAIVT